MTFAAPTTLETTAPHGGGLGASDLDGDGDVDLFFAMPEGVSYRENQGGGAFAAKTMLSTQFANELVLMDVDGDGKDDVVAYETSGLVWYPNQSTPGVLQFGSGFAIATLSDVYRAAAGDIDADGDLDLVTNGGDQVILYENQGGTFGSGVVLASSANSRDIALEDMTGNGYADVLFAAHRDQTFKILRNLGPHWSAAGTGHAGTSGIPVLCGYGDLVPGSSVRLTVTNGLPNAPVVFVIGSSRVDIPLLGGTLVPFPGITLPASLDEVGITALTATWPSGAPAGVDSYYQAWIFDGGASQSFAATNGLRSTSQ